MGGAGLREPLQGRGLACGSTFLQVRTQARKSVSSPTRTRNRVDGMGDLGNQRNSSHVLSLRGVAVESRNGVVRLYGVGRCVSRCVLTQQGCGHVLRASVDVTAQPLLRHCLSVEGQVANTFANKNFRKDVVICV
eukprot:293533-Chlamydomonas_euryale.AAC.4